MYVLYAIMTENTFSSKTKIEPDMLGQNFVELWKKGVAALLRLHKALLTYNPTNKILLPIYLDPKSQLYSQKVVLRDATKLVYM